MRLLVLFQGRKKQKIWRLKIGIKKQKYSGFAAILTFLEVDRV
jgi:hypothetical protein